MDDRESPQLSPQLNMLTNKAKDHALKKYYLIQPFLNQEKSLATICQEHQIPLRTARRWVTRYHQQGLIGLANKTRQDKNIKRSCTRQIQ